MSQPIAIKRGFADLPHGQMHYREAGDGAPLVMLHASPGSSRQLVSLIAAFADRAHIFAPDTPGNGDSVALPGPERTIAELAEAQLRFLDAMELDQVDLYGSHTGASVAAELAILAPDRIRAVVLDGVSVHTPEELADLLANYAAPFTPDREGAYLIRLFQFCRDQYFFFPWYNRTREGRRDGGLGSAADLHAWVTEVMKASETYHLNYHAAFRWPAWDRLRLLKVPALLMAAETDPLFDVTAQLAAVTPGQRFVALPRSDEPGFAERRKQVMTEFYASRGA